MDYRLLEQAYIETLIGANPPELLVARGDWIMAHRPDLKAILVPHLLYYVTKDEIRPVES
jgi:hypothetical protein